MSYFLVGEYIVIAVGVLYAVYTIGWWRGSTHELVKQTNELKLGTEQLKAMRAELDQGRKLEMALRSGELPEGQRYVQ